MHKVWVPTCASAASPAGLPSAGLALRQVHELYNPSQKCAAVPNESVAGNDAKLQAVLERATALCEPRDGLMKLDPTIRQSEAAALLLAVDAIPPGCDSRKARALRSLVRGTLLDEGEAHVPEAEAELGRAVKMDPTLGGAWNRLGTCMWKKGDVQLAHDCWQNTLMHSSDGEHMKDAMRKLSMAFRSGAGNNPDESLRLAKELISRDMSDTQSWTNLGNAYMSYFFASSLDREDLFRALKAYHRSDLDGHSQDPDLHFNKGTVYRYLQDYPNAVIELQRADELDKGLNASFQVQQMVELVHEMHSMISRQCNIKAGRLTGVLAALAKTGVDPVVAPASDYVDCPLNSLSEGWNPGKMVTVLIMAMPYTERPIHLVVADREGSFVGMSIYNMQTGKLKAGDILTALSPFLRYCSLPPMATHGASLHRADSAPVVLEPACAASREEGEGKEGEGKEGEGKRQRDDQTPKPPGAHSPSPKDPVPKDPLSPCIYRCYPRVSTCQPQFAMDV
jgi:tetratricopeptide (TPR) repeat protein